MPQRVGLQVRRAADRIPTVWAGAIGAGLVLGVTASFGGLNPVIPPPLGDVAVGETYTNDEISIAVHELIIADELTDVTLAPTVPAGGKIVLLLVTMTNHWNKPLDLLGDSRYKQNLSVTITDPEQQPTTDPAPRGTVILGDGMSSYSSRLLDDGSEDGLPPGVPWRMVLWTTIDAETAAQLVPGADVTVTLNDLSLSTASFFYDDKPEYWTDPVPARVVHLEPQRQSTVEFPALKNLVPS